MTNAMEVVNSQHRSINQSNFKPSYVWPNPFFPFRLYFDSPQCRIFIIENIHHNWKWMSECHQQFRKTDFFFVMSGWYQSPAFANEAETIFSVLNLDKTQFFFLYNSPLEMQNFAEKGFIGDVINQNAWIDSSTAIPLPNIEKIYHGIYVDYDRKYKRPQLADKVSKLALIGKINRQIIPSNLPAHQYINLKQLSPEEINTKINQSYCGLILSPEEGTCTTVGEYLLSGIPIVSTFSLGGREVWYNKYNSIVCEDSPDAIAKAVEKFVHNPPEAQRIRQTYLHQVAEYRAKFIQVLTDVFNRFGVVDLDPSSYFQENFYHRMRKNENIDFVRFIFNSRRDSDINFSLSEDYLQRIKQGGCFFIGASVTAQKNGWANQLVELLSKQLNFSFPVGKKVMGGVGLIFGVTKWQNTQLPTKAVVFIEFSTGDLNLGLTPLEYLEGLLEDLIIDLIDRNNLIIIIHNWRSDFRGKKGDPVRNIYNSVASRYKIPVIRNDIFVEQKLEEDPSLEKTWFRDNCHTNPEGAFVYASQILSKMYSQQDTISVSKDFNKDKTFGEIHPIFKLSNYFNSPNYTMNHYTYPSTGQAFTYYDCEDSVYFEAIVSGYLVGIALMSGPRSGWVELLIDGKSQKIFRCFDRHSYYERFILLPAFYNLSNSLVKIRLSEKTVDFTVAKKDHIDFKKARNMQLVSLIGIEINLLSTG